MLAEQVSPARRALHAHFLFKGTAFAAFLFVGGCSLVGDDHDDLEKRCRAEARIIVHHDPLWKEYIARANDNYGTRRREYSETGIYLPEYVAGFDERYGGQHLKDRTAVKGRVSRNDIYLIKNDEVVVQFVDFVLPTHGFSGTGVMDCAGLLPELYRWPTSAAGVKALQY